jgi:hypothetical protein
MCRGIARSPRQASIAGSAGYTRAMKIARFALILSVFAFASVLAACGNKGDLVRPNDNGAAAAN